MTKAIREYKQKIEAILTENSPDTDWTRLSTEMLVKIGFFQHERLVHLIVTMTVSILCVVCVLAMFIVETAPLALLLLITLFAVLLVPYILHYYYLENAVQKLYKYYGMVIEKL